jgi:hypothetical protein
MSNAKIDQNNRPTIICASKNDGKTIVPIQAKPTTHGLLNDDNTTGSDNGNNLGNAMLDENSNAVWTAMADDGSGVIVEVYGDQATGKILINSN